MDANAHQFLVLMLTLAGLAVAAGLIVALATFIRRAKVAALSDEPRPAGSRWFELLLAVVLLAALVVLLVAAGVSFFPDAGGPSTDWRSDPKESVFINLMLVVIVVLLAWIIILGSDPGMERQDRLRTRP
ncbi:MAG: hypothetical protein GKR94_13935 [Gammaproteobacteria bacterium]|nr:hypothetical protein [Gammaproteobacteria bacterium]